MVSVRRVPRPDLDAVRRRHNQYTADDASLETLGDWYDDTPELFVAAYDGATERGDGDDSVFSELVGVCIGVRHDAGHAELRGIGVDPDRRGEGIGSQLLAAFEAGAASVGVDRVSLGSAGGEVDRFYAQNGYSPESVLVRLPDDAVPDDYRDRGFDVVREDVVDDTRKLYVAAGDEVDPDYVASVREAFGDDDAIYIMSKALDDDPSRA